MSETKYVGKRLIRTDSLAKVTGSAKYTGDVWMKRKDMLYAKAKFPPFGRAKIISIDTSKAEKLPGVVAVMTAKDLPGFNGYGGVIPDKPVHQLWFDDETYMATRQFNQGRHIEMETSYIARFSKDGEEIEVLGGISNHMDANRDRTLFTGDRCYPDFSPNVYLYRRGDKNPIATFEIPQDEYTTWKLQVHPNPSFSRDGKRLYFNRQLKSENGRYKTEAVFADISEFI